MLSQDRHSSRPHTHKTERNALGNGGTRSLRKSDNVFDVHGDASRQQRDSVFSRGSEGGASPQSDNGSNGDNGDASRMKLGNIVRGDRDGYALTQQLYNRRVETANDTVYLDVHPSIQACECDGTACTAEEKHPGDSVSICLWSDFFEIAAVTNMTLRVGDFSYQPIVNGTANELTELELHGKLAVVTTMTISAFYENANPPDLVVDATVSFVPLDVGGGRRHLADITDYPLSSSSRSLLITRIDKSVVVFAWFCLLSTIIVLSAALGALVAKGYYCSACSTRSHDKEEDGTEVTCEFSK